MHSPANSVNTNRDDSETSSDVPTQSWRVKALGINTTCERVIDSYPTSYYRDGQKVVKIRDLSLDQQQDVAQFCREARNNDPLVSSFVRRFNAANPAQKRGIIIFNDSVRNNAIGSKIVAAISNHT